MATTLFADIDITVTTPQYVFVVSGVAHFTPKAPSRLAPVYALEAPRMLALVVVLQFGEYLVDSRKSLMRKDVWWCIPRHDLFCALFDAVDVGRCTVAVLPIDAADVAKFCTTETSLES
jgi:hypothetical protein